MADHREVLVLCAVRTPIGNGRDERIHWDQ